MVLPILVVPNFRLTAFVGAAAAAVDVVVKPTHWLLRALPFGCYYDVAAVYV
jgi:hypothetical protein